MKTLPASSFLVLAAGCSSFAVRPSARAFSGWVVSAVFPRPAFLAAALFARLGAQVVGVNVPLRAAPGGAFLVSLPCSPAFPISGPGRLSLAVSKALLWAGF